MQPFEATRRGGGEDAPVRGDGAQAFARCLEPDDDVTHPFGARPSSTLEPLLREAWKRSIAPGFVKLGLSCVSPAGPEPPVA